VFDYRDIKGFNEVEEYLGELRDYADDLWRYETRPVTSRRRTASNLALQKKKPVLPVQPSPFASLPHQPYRVIYSDPPWELHGVTGYPTMTAAKMAKVFPVAELNHPQGTVHFMWVVSSLLDKGIGLLRAWGYTYRTVAFAWVKTYGVDANGVPKLFMGLGGTTRGSVEICLEAHSGHPPSVAMNDVMQVVVAPLGQHSAKPAEVRNRIEELYPHGPHLEMFARNQFPGWDVFGNQVTAGVQQPTGAQTSGLISLTPPKPSTGWFDNRKVITTSEAAKILGVSPHRVIDFAKQGRIRAKKQGNQWAVNKRSVINFAKQPRNRKGGPQKKATP